MYDLETAEEEEFNMAQRGIHLESLLWNDPSQDVIPIEEPTMTKEDSDRFKAEILQLRRAYTDLFNRIGFQEQRVDANFNYVKRKQAEEVQLAIQEQNRQAYRPGMGQGAELVPYAEDVAKLPVKYTEKTFPYVTLPMLHAALFCKSIVRRLLSYLVPIDSSPDGTKAAMHQAEQERQLINIVRLQRQITVFQRWLAKAVRKNQDSLVGEVGKYTTENMIIAYALKDHFIEVGYKDVVVTSSQDKIFLHIEIYY